MSTPIYKARRNIENEMLAYAKRAARDGETAEQALVRLIDARDPQVEAMYNATSVMKQIDAGGSSREQAEAIMEQMAKSHATRTGVSQHEAAASLLRDNADYRKAYAIYVGLE